MIPGLEKAVFARLGSIHRNTYIDSPSLLDEFSRSRDFPNIFFAGQITGVEGYVESTASGLVVGLMAALVSKGVHPSIPSAESAIGGLLKHTRELPRKKYEPMNVNYGMIEQGVARRGKPSREEIAERSLMAVKKWKDEIDNALRNAGL